MRSTQRRAAASTLKNRSSRATSRCSASRGSARRGAGGRGAGGRARADSGRDHRRRLARLQARRRHPGKVEPEELGLPGVTVELPTRRQEGRVGDDASRRHLRVRRRRGRQLHASASAPSTFAKPFGGVVVARREADHAGDHHRLHLDLGRLRDGGDRGGARGHPARRRSRRPAPTAPPSGRSSAA